MKNIKLWWLLCIFLLMPSVTMAAPPGKSAISKRQAYSLHKKSHSIHSKTARHSPPSRFAALSHTAAATASFINAHFRGKSADAQKVIRLMGKPDKVDFGPPIGDAGEAVDKWHYRCSDGSVYLDFETKYGYINSGFLIEWGIDDEPVPVDNAGAAATNVLKRWLPKNSDNEDDTPFTFRAQCRCCALRWAVR